MPKTNSNDRSGSAAGRNAKQAVSEGLVSVRDLSRNATQILKACEDLNTPILITRHGRIIASLAPLSIGTFVRRALENDTELAASLDQARRQLIAKVQEAEAAEMPAQRSLAGVPVELSHSELVGSEQLGIVPVAVGQANSARPAAVKGKSTDRSARSAAKAKDARSAAAKATRSTAAKATRSTAAKATRSTAARA
jgi:antitoxin (DNA-binding transcriptional repressor) of toxin-antitoxin stability system